MRRMIPENKARVLDNFAVNKDGTQVEIGGNVVLESIDNIGILVDNIVDGKITGGGTGKDGRVFKRTSLLASELSTWTSGKGPHDAVELQNGEVFNDGARGILLVRTTDSGAYYYRPYGALTIPANGYTIISQTLWNDLVGLGKIVEPVNEKVFKPLFSPTAVPETLIDTEVDGRPITAEELAWVQKHYNDIYFSIHGIKVANTMSYTDDGNYIIQIGSVDTSEYGMYGQQLTILVDGDTVVTIFNEM